MIEDIENRLNNVIERIIGFRIPNDCMNKSFFTTELALKPRNLLAIFLEAENEFGIRFPREAVTEQRLETFDAFVSSIEKQLE